MLEGNDVLLPSACIFKQSKIALLLEENRRRSAEQVLEWKQDGRDRSGPEPPGPGVARGTGEWVWLPISHPM